MGIKLHHFSKTICWNPSQVNPMDFATPWQVPSAPKNGQFGMWTKPLQYGYQTSSFFMHITLEQHLEGSKEFGHALVGSKCPQWRQIWYVMQTHAILVSNFIIFQAHHVGIAFRKSWRYWSLQVGSKCPQKCLICYVNQNHAMWESKFIILQVHHVGIPFRRF